MLNTKKTKRALIISALSLLLCMTMLVGSTFAWFTDNASTAVNSIESGIIDIRLTDAEGNDMEGKTLNFVDANDKSDILWEPGCTFVTEPVRLWNYSNLTFALKTSIQGFKGDLELLDALEIKIVPYDTIFDESGKLIAFDEMEESYLKQWSDAYNGFPMQSWQYGLQADWTTNSEGVHTEHPGVGKPKPIEDICIVAHMKEEAGNEYQGLTLTGAGLLFQAAQLADEYDSYDNRYDADADYATVVTSAEELTDAIESAGDDPVDVVLPGGNFTLPTLNDKDVTISGNKDTEVKVETGVTANGGTITFNGITIIGADGDTFYTTQLNGAKKVIYKNCTIKGLISTYCDSEFIGCTFENNMADQYSVFCYGGDNFTFTNCTFNTQCSKAIKLYNEGANEKTLTVTNCTFSTSEADKAAIEIDSTYATKYTVNISGCTTSGSYTKLWNDKGSNSTVTVK